VSGSDLLTAAEAGEFLGVPETWLEKRRGKNPKPGGPPYVKLGGFVRYRRRELEEFVRTLPVGGAEPSRHETG